MTSAGLVRCALVTIGVVASTARADVSPADVKFQEAQQLRAANKNAEACEAFRASLALNPNAIGAILNVARCAEEEGKTGTALRTFSDALDRAREQGLDPQRAAAEGELAKLAPIVPHLAIAFAQAPAPDTRILVDDRVVTVDAAGDIVVDPGAVKVVVSAPGRVSFVATIEFDPKLEHEHKAIAVPALGYPIVVSRTHKTMGKILAVGGAGVAIAAIGIGFLAKHDYNNAVARCHAIGTTYQCDPEIYNDVQSARTLGNVGTGVAIGGLAIVAIGVTLWLVIPDRSERAVAIVPSLDSSQVGFAAVGRF